MKSKMKRKKNYDKHDFESDNTMTLQERVRKIMVQIQTDMDKTCKQNFKTKN